MIVKHMFSWFRLGIEDFSLSRSYLHLLLLVNKSYLDFQFFSLLSELIVAQPCMRTSNTVKSAHSVAIEHSVAGVLHGSFQFQSFHLLHTIVNLQCNSVCLQEMKNVSSPCT